MPTERLYYHDSYLTRFTATVADVRRFDGNMAVVLDRTAFYPTSGGQPCDAGTLDERPVRDVVDGEEVLHIVDGEPPVVGALVEGVVDWERRFDHIQQHSGQHILSQAFERTIGAHTVSFHLSALSSTIDLDVAPLSPEAVAGAERLANQIVAENRAVTVHYVQPDELERFGLRKPTERPGTIRIVEFADFDASACGGTHVPHASVVGLIKIRRIERRGNASRVEFVCGRRAIEDYTWKNDVIRRIGERLTAGEREVEAAVLRLLDQLEAQKDELRALREQALAAEAERLLRETEEFQTSAGPVRIIRANLPDRSPDDLKRLAAKLTVAGPVVALLGSVGGKTGLVFAQTPGLPFAMNTLLGTTAKAIGGRGGGTRDLAQGGAPGAVEIEQALDSAAAAIVAEATPGGG